MTCTRANSCCLYLITRRLRIAATTDTADLVLYERFIGGERNIDNILSYYTRDLGYINNSDSRDWRSSIRANGYASIMMRLHLRGGQRIVVERDLINDAVVGVHGEGVLADSKVAHTRTRSEDADDGLRSDEHAIDIEPQVGGIEGSDNVVRGVSDDCRGAVGIPNDAV